MRKPQINIEVSDETKQWYQTAAKSLGMSLSYMVRHAVETYIKEVAVNEQTPERSASSRPDNDSQAGV